VRSARSAAEELTRGETRKQPRRLAPTPRSAYVPATLNTADGRGIAVTEDMAPSTIFDGRGSPESRVKQLRSWLRTVPWYVQLRKTQRIGFVRWARWKAREAKILKSAPVRTRPVGDPGAPCELRLLTWHRDWQLGLWAAKSFYHFAGVDWPVAFHDGGGLNAGIRAEILKHFPQASIVGWDEATASVEPRLLAAGHLHLAEGRKRNVMFRKLVDFAMFARAPNMVCLDSDILFVGKPTELVRLGESTLDRPHFNRDREDSYSIRDEDARAWFGLELPSRLNAGLSVMPVRAVDFDFLESLFAPGRIPVDKDVFPEQTACALLAARLGVSFLPPEYMVVTDTPPLDVRALGLISRHYVGPQRHLLYDEGMRFLLRETDMLQRRRTA
jgi:hypothetical protein